MNKNTVINDYEETCTTNLESEVINSRALETMLRDIAIGFCELIDEQKRMNKLLGNMIKCNFHNTTEYEQLIKECYGDPKEIKKENKKCIREMKNKYLYHMCYECRHYGNCISFGKTSEMGEARKCFEER